MPPLPPIPVLLEKDCGLLLNDWLEEDGVLLLILVGDDVVVDGLAAMMWFVKLKTGDCTKFCWDSWFFMRSSILSILYTYVNQSRVVEDRFWAEEIGELLEELTADVEGC